MAKVLHFILSLLYQCAELVVLRVGAVYQLRCSTCWYCVSAVLCYVLVLCISCVVLCVGTVCYVSVLFVSRQTDTETGSCNSEV